MNRADWLAERRKHIGASDAAAILGFDPRRGPLTIHHQKINGYSQDDNDWMSFGRDVEGAISNLYVARTDRHVSDIGATSIQYHSDYPWIGATLDRFTSFDNSECGPLELKHVSRFDMSPNQWREDPPIQYQCQLQIQMACTGAKMGTLAGMFPGYELAYCDLKRDDEFLEYAYPILQEFWEGVVNKTPPEPSGGDLEAAKQIWATPNNKMIPLDADALKLAEAWDKAKKTEKDAEKEKKEIEAKLRHVMQDNEFGALPDGRFLTLKLTQKKAYTVNYKEQKYRTLRLSKTMGKKK